MKLVSTREKDRDGDEAAGKSVLAPVSAPDQSGPRYKWGCQLTLDTELLSALGLDISNLTVGQEIKVGGMGKITALRSEQCCGTSETSVNIQLEQVGAEPQDVAQSEFDAGWDEATE